MNAIHLTTTGNNPIVINVDRIDAVHADLTGAKVFVGGANCPFYVKDSYSDIIVKLAEIEVTK